MLSDSFSMKYFLILILNSILFRMIVKLGSFNLFQILGKEIRGSFSAKLVLAKGTKRSSLFRRIVGYKILSSVLVRFPFIGER